jgi:YD repeat-containing protein
MSRNEVRHILRDKNFCLLEVGVLSAKFSWYVPGIYNKVIRWIYGFIVVVIFSNPIPAFSQQQGTSTMLDNTSATPILGIGHEYIQDLDEIVNPANGAVSIRIAAPAPHERGVNLPLYAYIYDTSGQINIWPDFEASGSTSIPWRTLLHSITASVGQGWYSSGGNTLTGAPNWIDGSTAIPSPGAPGTVSSSNTTVTMSNANDIYSCTLYSNYIYTDTSGGRHPLNLLYMIPAEQNEANCGNLMGVDIPITTGGDGIVSAVLVSAEDVLIFDLHGDQLDSNYVYGNTNGVEDTNGNYQNGSGRPYAGVYEGDNPSSLSIPGLAKPYTFSYPTNVQQSPPSPVSLNAVAATSNDPTCPKTFGESFGGAPLVSSTGNTVINLPNGQFYTISFDPNYGFVKEIQYPTGATVSYTWGNNPQSDSELFFQSGSPECGYTFDWPAVQSRIVSFDGVHNAQEQDFTYSTNWGSKTNWKTTTVTTKDLLSSGTPSFKTVYTYVPMPVRNVIQGIAIANGSYLPLENTIQYYDTSGSLLKTVTKSWNTNYLQPQLASECTTLPNGQTSGTFYKYLGDTQLHTDVLEFDYGAVTSPCQQPSSRPMRETVTAYQAFANSPISGTSVIQDRPCSVIVYGNGAKMAETDYVYDGGTTVCGPAGTPSVAPVSAYNHDETNYGVNSKAPRGNVTRVIHVCVQGCTANSVTQYAYDETGQIVSVTDPNNNPPTAYSYTDNYVSSDGAPSANTNTYVTTITGPVTNGVSHIQTFTYGFEDGKMRSSTDENSKTTQYCYFTGGCSGGTEDPWARLTEISYPDGGSTQQSYSDAGPEPYTITTTALTSSVSISKKTTMDAYGHTIQTELTSDPSGPVNVVTTYDGLGRVASVTNPYRNSSEPTYGTTYYFYDALNRPIFQTQPDSTTLKWCYNDIAPSTPSAGMKAVCNSHLGSVTTGSWVDVTDENGNTWQRTSDAWGRLTEVMEPNGTTQTPGMETDYAYSALDNLIQVKQWGGANGSTGARSRSFSYDSFSRLLQAFNPEAGWTCYGTTGGAAPNGANCTSGYDANGNLLYKTDARAVTTHYTYDALNRVLSRSYAQDANQTPFVCYQYDASSTTNSIGRLSSQWTQRASVGACAAAPPASGILTRHSILAYDVMGRIHNEQQCTPSNCTNGTPYAPSYTYNLAGSLATSTNGITTTPTVNTLTFTNGYDAAGHLQTVMSNWNDSVHPPFLFSAQTATTTTCPQALSPPYTPFGGLANATFGSNLTLNRAFDSRSRITCENDAGSVVANATSGSATVTITGSEQSQ